VLLTLFAGSGRNCKNIAATISERSLYHSPSRYQYYTMTVSVRPIQVHKSRTEGPTRVKFGGNVLHCAHNWQPHFWTVRKKVRVIQATLNFESAMIWWQSLLTRSAMDSVTAGFSRCRTATKWRWVFSRCH